MLYNAEHCATMTGFTFPCKYVQPPTRLTKNSAAPTRISTPPKK